LYFYHADSNSDVLKPARRSGQRRPWARPEKRKLFFWDDRTVCAGADESEHCREFKEMNFHFAPTADTKLR
jgi:hypothetical protein